MKNTKMNDLNEIMSKICKTIVLIDIKNLGDEEYN